MNIKRNPFQICLLGALLLIVCFASTAHAADGSPAWTNLFNGTANGGDAARSLAVDSSGNVYVTGASTNSDSGADYATIKYSSAGIPQWTNYFNGTGNGDDVANSLAVDGNGNVYVTGYSYGGVSSNDYASIKYSSTGIPQWTNIYNGAANNDDKAQYLAVDGSGNVYVTGYSSETYYDYLTIKYSSTGIPQWTNRYNGTGNYIDQAHALAVDSNGNIYVTGNSVGIGVADDYATIKYSSAGIPQWTNRYNGPGNNTDQANSLAVDASGNVYVTGNSYGGASGFDYATLKYSSVGVALWTNRFNGAANSSDAALSLALDGSGDVYVTGVSLGSGSSNDYATIKYSSAGTPQWTNRFNGTGNGSDVAYSLALDGSGNVYVTGGSISSGSGLDYATIKYSNAGIPLWTNLFNGAGNSTDRAVSLAVDGSGNIYVTGYSTGSGSGLDYATIKYSSALTITSQLLSGGDMRFSCVGIAGTNYVLDRTFNLSPTVNWVPQVTNPAGVNGVLILTNTPNPATNNFWRIHSIP